MSYTVDERTTGIHGLQGLSQEWCLTSAYKRYDTQESIIATNAADIVNTRWLYDILLRKQHEDGVRDVYENLLLPAANAFAEISYHGIRIDVRALLEIGVEWEDEYTAAEDELTLLAQEMGWSGKININSPKQLSKLLYEVAGLPHPDGLTTNAKALAKIAHMHKFVDKLLTARTVKHMLGTYGFGIFDDIKPDGKVHASVLLHGAGTGRTSYTNPPLQTIPSAMDERFVKIRRIIVPDSPDYCIVDADLSQAEIWTGYGYSGDERLLVDLQDPRTIHTLVALDIFKLPEDAPKTMDPLKWKRFRTDSKHVTFGRMYGREARALAEGELKCSVAEAAGFVGRWNRRYATYIDWTKEIRQQLIKYGEIVSVTGRKRRFYTQRDNDALRKAINFPIQSTSSDIKLAALTELHAALKPYDSRILFEVHDSIVFHVARKHLQEVLLLIRECMERSRWGFPSIPVEIAVGPNLFDTEKVS